MYEWKERKIKRRKKRLVRRKGGFISNEERGIRKSREDGSGIG